MSKNRTSKGGDEVGYRKPPKQHQFKPGQSGNPKGRPKSRNSGAIDISEILNEPVAIRVGEKRCEMSSFEVGFRQQVSKALEGDLSAKLNVIKLFEEHGVIAPPPAETGGVIFAPKGVSVEDWLEEVTEIVPIDQE